MSDALTVEQIRHNLARADDPDSQSNRCWRECGENEVDEEDCPHEEYLPGLGLNGGAVRTLVEALDAAEHAGPCQISGGPCDGTPTQLYRMPAGLKGVRALCENHARITQGDPVGYETIAELVAERDELARLYGMTRLMNNRQVEMLRDLEAVRDAADALHEATANHDMHSAAGGCEDDPADRPTNQVHGPCHIIEAREAYAAARKGDA